MEREERRTTAPLQEETTTGQQDARSYATVHTKEDATPTGTMPSTTAANHSREQEEEPQGRNATRRNALEEPNADKRAPCCKWIKKEGDIQNQLNDKTNSVENRLGRVCTRQPEVLEHGVWISISLILIGSEKEGVAEALYPNIREV